MLRSSVAPEDDRHTQVTAPVPANAALRSSAAPEDDRHEIDTQSAVCEV
ncbi:hypothetical protein ACIPPN_26995 [Streptomyces diastaticus]